MITLYQFPRLLGLPNLSPYCVKVELLLRMAGIDYEPKFVMNPSKGPKGKLPAIDDNGTLLGDSALIVKYLKKNHGLALDESIDTEQRAVSLAFEKMLDEHLYWPIVYARWQDPAYNSTTKDTFAEGMPKLLFPLIWRAASRGIIKQIHGQGTGRHTPEEIYAFGCDAVDALSDYLGDKVWFLGDGPHTVDAAVFSYVVALIDAPYRDPVSEHCRSKANLVAYKERLKQEYFSDI